MQKPKWLYSWTWTEADEIRLNGAAGDLEELANELSTLAQTCYTQGENGLSSDLITDAGSHYEGELNAWKQKIENEVVSNLRVAATAIRSTVLERQTSWDKFQSEVIKFNKGVAKQAENITEQVD